MAGGIAVIILSVAVLVELVIILTDDYNLRRMDSRLYEERRRRDEQIKEAVKLEMEKMQRKEKGISVEMEEMKN